MPLLWKSLWRLSAEAREREKELFDSKVGDKRINLEGKSFLVGLLKEKFLDQNFSLFFKNS